MVLMKEIRIVMPVSLEEYQVAQTYMVMKMQKQNTTSTEGVEIVESRPFEDDVFGKGHYSSKIYRLQSKAPGWLTTFAPAEALILQEEAWNAYPRCKTGFPSVPLVNCCIPCFLTHFELILMGILVDCKCMANGTVIKCPYFTKFQLTVETVHRADKGHSDNDKSDPVMTAYKLVTIDAPYWGFGNKLEQALLLGERALFLESHRNCFSWIDEWFGMTVEQIRESERHRNSETQELGRPPLVKSLEDFDQRLLPESEEIYSGQRAQLST
ncbi:uncharacterized protein [Pyrus communis]|uniref:uncharacterized protein isoform X2 n=1 Tax=Pyrus communis TaxID=23211 RepID=UPI0035BFF6EE